MVRASDIKTLSLAEIEQLIDLYPWFSFARKEYFERMASMGQENTAEAARKIGLFVISRAYISSSIKENIARKSRQAETRNVNKPKYVVVGGDYFGKEDFDELERDGLAFERLSFSPYSGVLNGISLENKIEEEPSSNDSEDLLCTETLAGIYAEQGFIQRAIDIYSKLILLYPQKSVYFVSLIENVKSKNN